MSSKTIRLDSTGIRCEGVWKRYRPRSGAVRYRTLRDDLAAMLRRSGSRGSGGKPIWALRDLTLNVPRGEALGIIGSNGSGKSTLLKLIAGVTYPTRGSIEVRGRTGAFIEVGSGMHPELTGRENIHLYGTIIGLSRRETQRKFESIVEFAELAPHLDQPVKHYSSGMKIRLGFSIAAHVDPDILLVDEVLAVGDAAFQRKCLQKISDMLASDVIILYVSHELTSLERLCQRTLWLDGGEARALGASGSVVRAYLQDVETRLAARSPRNIGSRDGFLLERVALTDGGGIARAHFETGEPLTVSLFYTNQADFAPAQVAVKLLDDRMRTIALAIWDAPREDWPTGRGILHCTFQSLPLTPRLYQIWAQVLRRPDYREVVPWSHLGTFAITDGERQGGLTPVLTRGREAPLVVLPTTWRLEAPEPAAADG